MPDRQWVPPAALAVVAAAVLVASLLPARAAGPAPTVTLRGVGADKWLHGVGYAALAVTLAATLSGRAGRAVTRAEAAGRTRTDLRRWHDVRCALVAVAVAVVAGAGVELLQWPLATRTASAGDALANAVGALVGAGAWLVVRRRRG